MSTGSSFWDRKYGRRDYVYGTEPNRFLGEHIAGRLEPGTAVLTLGEGEGRNAVWLASQGYAVTAVDYSRPALEKLQFLARSQGVEVRSHLSDVMDFELRKARWDAVVLLHMHLPPRKRSVLHRRIAKALRPMGFLFLEALRCDQFGRPSGGPERPELFYSAQTLLRDFQDLVICRLVEEDRFIESGEHRGWTSVVNLIARK